MVTDTREKNQPLLQVNPIVLPAGLYLVATPIGNLRDVSLRALDVLNAVSVLYCEDTRVSGKLLQAYQIKKTLYSYNDHADDKKREDIFRRIESGEAVGLISDAGMPLISDPGYKLVRECIGRGFRVSSVPGASAPLMALQISGCPSDAFTFIGFLPAKEKARRDMLGKWLHVEGSLIAFETGPRLLASLKDMRVVLGNRQVAVTRELTKMYEEVRRDSLESLIAYYEDAGRPKGEIVVVIDPPVQEEVSEAQLIERLREAMQSMRMKEAANFVAEATGISKKRAYDLALQIKGT